MTRAAEIINQTADEDALVIWGHSISEDAGNTIRITVIATGFAEGRDHRAPLPQSSRGNGLSVASVRPSLRGNTNLSFEETDLLPPPAAEEDMFTGVPKTAYDTPAIFRRKPRK